MSAGLVNMNAGQDLNEIQLYKNVENDEVDQNSISRLSTGPTGPGLGA